MSWHVQPPQDIYVSRDTAVVGLDPPVADTAVDQQERKTALSSKVGMDATRFPALSVPPQEAQSPSYSAAYRCLRTLFAHLGRDEDAREAAARALETDPAFTISAYIDRGGQSNAKLFIEGLRKAWLPE